MAANRSQLHILAYDISGDPRRLAEVHRTVRRKGFPLQYSVFLVPARPAEIQALLSELATIIDPRRDDIRVYPLPAKVDIDQLGRGSGIDGTDLFKKHDHASPIDVLLI
ncbi:CRISPR-associated endonuclease Cas2 [Thioalkalicoccus limnaeus]|uniref:CRISPR-associated endoribonuclease Cas2 n=1 Tax=Thioalkalicoccus limnaeus TaxID=120681 RepID=A0ABV4BGF4_9GAMM